MKLFTKTCAFGLSLVSFSAAPAALVSVTQSTTGGTAVNANAPQIEPGFLINESYAYNNRTHEITAARFDPGTNLLATSNVNTTLLQFPTYLTNAQWVANANENRAAGIANDAFSYTVTYTVNTAGTAYLLLDNRLNGSGSAVNSPNTTDPDLGGSLAWVINDGWIRRDTGIKPPGGSGDYVGVDEGNSVATPDLRTHTAPGLVAGSGEGLNNFYAIYSKNIPGPGNFVTRSTALTASGGNMYVVAFASVPEPTASLLGALAVGLLASRRRRI